MASWNQIASEIAAIKEPNAHDIVRRRKIGAVQELTGRHLIIYAADFLTSNPVKQSFSGTFTITLTEKDGFDEVTRRLSRDRGLDVLLHSPGGLAEATESIVKLLRARFNHIRFIIPNAAKSAATMLALSGNELLLDERSELGPIDPQFRIVRDGQVVQAPAQAIKDQFDLAQRQIQDQPESLPAWVPIIRQYGPALLAECDHHLELARILVAEWLAEYMFAGDPKAAERARTIAEYLADHRHFHSHGRSVGMHELQQRGVKILDLNTYPQLHEAIRDLYTTIAMTFDNTGAIKLFENGQDDALINIINIVAEPPGPQPALHRPLPSQRVARGKPRA